MLYALFAAALCVASDSVPATPTPLTLQDVQRLVLARNHELHAARYDTLAARGALRQAKLIANPQLSLVVPGHARQRDETGPVELALTQEIEWGGQRGLRMRTATYARDRMAAELNDTQRVQLADATLAFYRLLAEQHKLRVTEEIATITRQLLDAVRAQLREGEISALEANLVGIEAGRAQARVWSARRNRESAALALKQLVALDASQLIVGVDGDPPAIPGIITLPADQLTALAERHRPDFLAANSALAEVQSQLSLARRERLPALTLGLLGERTRTTRETRLGWSLGVGIPLWHRNQGNVMQNQAEQEGARWRLQAMRARIRTEVLDAVQTYRSAHNELEVYDGNVLRPARRNRILLDSAYRAGKIALPTLLLLRNQLLDAELEYWDVWLSKRHALVQLNTVLATEIW